MSLTAIPEQERPELTPSSLRGQDELGDTWKGPMREEDEDSQRAVNSASLSKEKGQEHSLQADTKAVHSQLQARGSMSPGYLRVPTITDLPLVEPSPRGTLQQRAQTRTNPIRNGRPPEGNTEHLTILLDTVAHGKLPEDYQPSGPTPHEIIKQPGDIPDSWVAQSHFFPDAGLGFFFEVKGPYKRRGGALLAVYYGQDSYTEVLEKIAQAANRAPEFGWLCTLASRGKLRSKRGPCVWPGLHQ
jgi:hypothetical protein